MNPVNKEQMIVFSMTSNEMKVMVGPLTLLYFLFY